MGTFKKTAKWTGIVLIGLCGVVLLDAGKIQSGTLLILTAFILVVPVKRHRNSPSPLHRPGSGSWTG